MDTILFSSQVSNSFDFGFSFWVDRGKVFNANFINENCSYFFSLPGMFGLGYSGRDKVLPPLPFLLQWLFTFLGCPFLVHANTLSGVGFYI